MLNRQQDSSAVEWLQIVKIIVVTKILITNYFPKYKYSNITKILIDKHKPI